MNWFKLADGDFRLFPLFLNVRFQDNQGDISIDDWVEMLYQAKQIELLTKIHLHVNSKGNYLIYHNMDITLNNTQVTYWFMENKETTKNHKIRDINFLKKHRELFYKLQTDVYNIIIAMENSHELNKKIASVYKNVSPLDAQDIFDYHQNLYETAANVITNKGNEEWIKNPNINLDIKENDISEALDIIKDIENHPDKYNFSINFNMPAFDWELFDKMDQYTKNPHVTSFWDNNKNNYIYFADLAGNKTNQLLNELKEVYISKGRPIRDPHTGVYMPTFDRSRHFRGELYLHLVQYAVEQFEEYGRFPRCSWCGALVSPKKNQKRALKNGARIYCHPTSNQCEESETCYGKQRRHDQNTKRNQNKQKKQIVLHSF
ncbi:MULTISPECIES: hypothetical protein [Bacillus cereus group]|uniref:Uncharacterized protein n=1 Tax=Bacillus cereus (strain Q1) TaxID=361100 RepID=B9IZ94_BACCQ|nr:MULTISPECIES: hypothetical protein [Bacillus cereus group]ACM14733.1 hypothetical protein BCQ_4307 [Bacillus cereus Q1]MCY9249722.1 hypothetical protein [Bacillus paranthracis]MDA1499631.1 hypothetical protein [Bacillus cereus group sp. TH41-1LC]MDA1661228.1 hypothetical protein [Bacillus cereus group sp. TH153LC]MDA1929584.1 hypothetical protein [Bacillus cereus group sp. BcHK130]